MIKFKNKFRTRSIVRILYFGDFIIFMVSSFWLSLIYKGGSHVQEILTVASLLLIIWSIATMASSYGVTSVSIKRFCLLWTVAVIIGVIQVFMFLKITNSLLILMIIMLSIFMFTWRLLIRNKQKK